MGVQIQSAWDWEKKRKSRVEWNTWDQCVIIVLEDFENGFASTCELRPCKAEVCWKFVTTPLGGASSCLRKRCLHLDCHAGLSKDSWIEKGKSFFKVSKCEDPCGLMDLMRFFDLCEDTMQEQAIPSPYLFGAWPSYSLSVTSRGRTT